MLWGFGHRGLCPWTRVFGRVNAVAKRRLLVMSVRPFGPVFQSESHLAAYRDV